MKDLIDYMQQRVDDGCGRIVPQALHTALVLIEQTGKVPESARLSYDPLQKGHVKSWGAELATDAPPRKPAEMYTTAMLIALELCVCDRALAWVVLA